jgi:hypothetical protein
MRRKSQSIALRLPPFSFICGPIQKWLARRNIIHLHYLILAILYGIFALSASIEGTVVIRNGIGILQNPPFFVHLLCSALSVPLVFIFAFRIFALSEAKEEESVINSFVSFIRKSKIKNALFGVAFLVGLFALAYTITLSISYKNKVNIYDSLIHPLTFGSYFFIRLYSYLFCYPLVFAAAPTITYHFFKGLRRSPVPYRPFHYDEMGGLRKYFVAVDRPVYAVQSFAVLIALMNYFGWGGMKLVPVILTIAAPIVVTLLAVFLFVHFRKVLAFKKKEEIQAICQQRMDLYASARNLASLDSKACLELLQRIEAAERLIESIRKENRNDLKKYVFNIAVLIIPQLVKPIGDLLAKRFFGGAP